MKYLDEFRGSSRVSFLGERIRRLMPRGRLLRIMEVCGTHTHAVCRFGLGAILPENLKLISGPGCPVCVSSREYIDSAIFLASDPLNIVITFGDMLRVPGGRGSLEQARGEGADVRVVYSPGEALAIAAQNLARRVIFLGVGFETTASAIAVTVEEAHRAGTGNLFFLVALKTMPAAMRALLSDPRTAIDGFLCPGHVSAIIGSDAYRFIPRRYKIGCCVAGFEPVDIMEGIYCLLTQIVSRRPRVQNQYTRVVRPRGNPVAQSVMRRVFSSGDAQWRGIGVIKGSGLLLKREFSGLDAAGLLRGMPGVKNDDARVKRCRCGDVIKGIIIPPACPLFRGACTPQTPVGPCMVSFEGACHAYYLYR